MLRDVIEKVEFVGTRIALIREEQVRQHLSLDDAITDLSAVLKDLAQQQAVNYARIRVESRERHLAWLHTLRAGMTSLGVAGGKDYTSIGFDTPAMWATVVNSRTGLPLALIESDYLSRVRTAATTAIATDLLAPPDVACLAHFGAGKISELLVRAILKVRPSVRQVFLVRRDISKGAPDWLYKLGGVQAEINDAVAALTNADLVTTATSSRIPVIPPDAEMHRVRHINLVGSNHLKRKEISDKLARRCLLPDGYFVVDDSHQAALEAGDFAALEQSGELKWSEVPTLAQLLNDPAEKKKSARARFTAFKSVGTGLMDLAVATGVLRRMQLLPGQSPVPEEGDIPR